MSELDDLKSNLATAIRLLTAEGLMDFNGHLSVRTPADPNKILINPRSVSRASVTGGDIVTTDLRGALIDGALEPPSETPIHTAIYRLRPDVVSVARARTASGHRLHVVHNWSWDPTSLHLPLALADALSGARFAAGAQLELGPWDVRVLLENLES